MIKFEEIVYKRPDYESIAKEIEKLTKALKTEEREEEQLFLIQKIISIQNEIEEMSDYADICNMRDLNDPFYKSEMEYWNAYQPKYDVLFLPFYKWMLRVPLKSTLRESIPPNFFTKIDYQLKITNEACLPLQKRENELKSAFRLLYKDKIAYNGKEVTRGELSADLSSSDRSIRASAHQALNDHYYAKQKEYDALLYEMIGVRNELAHQLGFKDYVTYSLYALNRFGYGYDEIHAFRDNIVQYICPLCDQLRKIKQEELGISDLQYYDTIFFEQMPTLLQKEEALLECLKDSFVSIDKPLGTLYQTMLENGYIDFLPRENKVYFSITNYLAKSGLPVITGNFKNTYEDVRIATHEMGHAFQKYCASIQDKEQIVSSLLKYPTMEIAEMFSYGMEMKMAGSCHFLFSGVDQEKYVFMEYAHLILDMPYICLVDEFQETLYTTPDLKKEEIRPIWLRLAKKYHLEKANQGHINLEEGGYFYRQSHIYLNPFYYIDYALSYFGAFALAESDMEVFKNIGAVASYYTLLELIEKYHLPSPFDEDVVQNISKKLESKIQKTYSKIKEEFV